MRVLDRSGHSRPGVRPPYTIHYITNCCILSSLITSISISTSISITERMATTFTPFTPSSDAQLPWAPLDHFPANECWSIRSLHRQKLSEGMGCNQTYLGFQSLLQKQITGIPIGGPVSGAILEATLSVDEHHFEKIGWKSLARECGIQGDRELWMAISRYVDDVFIATPWFCQSCCEYIVKRICSKTVSFDTSCEGQDIILNHNTVKFLDLWLYMSWSTFYATLVNKNDMFAITGNIALKGKNRFPIAYGDYYMLHKRLVCDIQARLAKFTRFNLTKMRFTYF